MILAMGLVGLGLVLLVTGGDALVRGAVSLSERLGISPLVIGLVVVGFGTSAPELVTSIEAALAGVPGIAWGNIVGSNIANSLLILGVAVLVAPMTLVRATSLRDPLVAILAAIGLMTIAYTGLSVAAAGVVGLLLIAGYIIYCYRQGSHDSAQDADLHEPSSGHWSGAIITALVGLALLIAGGRFLVMGAVDLAELAGLSETIIGLTIVALGTSAPELATVIIAARHNQMAVVFGNIIGSNIYNILAIGSVTLIIAPGQLPADLLTRDLPVMFLSMLVILGVAWRSGTLGRWAGLGLVGSYVAYLTALVVAQM